MTRLHRRLSLAALPLLLLSGSPALADEGFFQSPTGNIHCLYIPAADGEQGWLRCDMLEGEQSYKRPPQDCELDWGLSFYVGDRGEAGLTCHGDTVQNPTGAVLGYGSKVQYGSISCEVEKTGVTCKNRQGHGFSLSRARQKIF